MIYFESVGKMLEWYLKLDGTLYVPPSVFGNMISKSQNSRNSVPAATRKMCKDEPHTQIVATSNKHHASNTYCMEDEIIAKADFELIFRKLSKIDQKIVARFCSQTHTGAKGRTVLGGMPGACALVRKYYGKKASTQKKREDKVMEILWKLEDMLVEADYIRPHWSCECEERLSEVLPA